MKKLFYIMTAALVTLTACTKEIDWDQLPLTDDEPDAVYPEGAKVDLYFSVPAPIGTKGFMADDPEIDVLYVAVFDGSGSLKEYVEAEPVEKKTDTVDGEEVEVGDYVDKNGVANAKHFKARVTLKSSERRLHFIANGPSRSEITSGMESTLLQKWMTMYPNAAYWQRIVLPNGITAYTFPATNHGTAWESGNTIDFYYFVEEEDGKEVYVPAIGSTQGAEKKTYTISVSTSGRASYKDGAGFTVNQGDFVDARGYKILDGTGYFQSDEVAGQVSLVPMVRNFARIKIVAGEGNFTPTQFYLMNIPDRGTIAPYSASAGGFIQQYAVSNYVDGDWVSEDPEIATATNKALMTSLNGSTYQAAMPSSAKFIHTVAEVKANNKAIPGDWKSYTITDDVETTESAFLFERSTPNSNQDPVYLLMGGVLDGHDQTRWFKIELNNSLGQYFRIFRGVTYALEIGQIDGSDGYPSAAEAAVGTPVSDVSNATATENLEQVSDGKGTSMWVEYIDKVSMGVPGTSGDLEGETVTILYKVYDSSTGDALDPYITKTVDGESVEEYRYTLTYDGVAITGASDQSGVTVEEGLYTGPDKKTDWQKATVSLAAPNASVILKSTLTIAGITKDGEDNESGKTLSRKVKYNVMTTQKLDVSAEPLEDEKSGRETALTIKLPKGLGFSMFPLVLKIEAEKGNLNPVASKNMISGEAVDLPVQTGTSYFSDKNTFYFLLTINYSDYFDSDSGEYNTDYTLYFATTKDYSGEGATGSNETWFSVTDMSGYFKNRPDDEADLYNDRTSGAEDPHINYAVTPVTVTNGNEYFIVTPINQTVAADVTTATFKVQTNTGQEWTVERGTNALTVSPSSGKGNGVVTVSFAANQSTTSSRTIYATITPDGGTGQPVTVTQQKVLEHHTGTYNLTFANNNYNNNSYTDNGTGTNITFANYENAGNNNNSRRKRMGTRSGYYNNYTYNNGTITITAPIGGNRVNGKITKITITYYDNNNTQAVTYDPAATGSTKTEWTGSADSVTITMACTNATQYGERNEVSGIAVQYEYDD